MECDGILSENYGVDYDGMPSENYGVDYDGMLSKNYGVDYDGGEEEIYQCSELQQVVHIFRDENACPDVIDEAGQSLRSSVWEKEK
ncbi:hypothetical protein AVEN_150907-1 [Araneus ventricosus]|uniref:Uncharacterized protein n=1 Tax=Araneus ventricosus TaxID=182803 RepID=A0A4Y2C9A0_ARAVE|nr:hypothetical protein AVEN_150907-1 [Araneus ventricosus]